MNIINCGVFLFSVIKLIRYNNKSSNLDQSSSLDQSSNLDQSSSVGDNAIKCGPIGIKLLQFLLMRNGLIKTNKLDFALEDTLIHDFKHTEEMYFKEYSRQISDDYTIPDNIVPIGSGSIGQVYKLWDIKLNKFIAIKVKHPGITDQINAFTKSIKLILWIFGYFIPFKNCILEFLNNIHTQLNYQQESENINRFRNAYSQDSFIIIPEVYSWSSNFIMMSYHSGNQWNTLNKKNKLLISMYINFIVMSSMLIHDCLHADFHYGNFKITDSLQLVIYDCGIMCSTGDLIFNKKFMECVLNNNYTKLLYLIADRDKITLIPRFMNELNKQGYTNASNRIKQFVYKVVNMRMSNNKSVINILNAFCMVADVQEISINVFTKYIVSPDQTDDSNAIILYTYAGFLEKMGKFKNLSVFFKEWMDLDPQNKSIYTDWLLDSFGHSEPEILYQVIHNIFI